MYQSDESNGIPVPPETDDRMARRDVIRMVRDQIQAFFEGARGSHDWDHTERVFRLCERIGSLEGADMDVLLIAAYLHDIGRSRQDSSNGAVCHADAGARMAASVVAKLPMSDARRENILHSIRSHRFRGRSTPRTLEARVLFDADKLDAIGAVGVARAFLFAGEVGARLHNPDIDIETTKPYSREDTGYREYKVKLCKVKDRMLTSTGRRLAEERHYFMEQFFQRLQDEHEGKR
ncbi:hypothetical protein D3OALGA1CA_3213 [Olavius algarvensis associated proteobacterium Delta 3]|nr:metal dependent phosphohydrolase [Olavius algarvensis associated proteobacterium Delta 3]CAB5130825.1 hypothetical protein D3OALGA1CA_3213 [Olavius algarvensis associated proteobacterium Delta 3]